MNRYICAGILADLAAGQSVLIVSRSLREGEHAHRALLEHAGSHGGGGPGGIGYAWSLANGGQWLRDERSKVAATFTSIRSGMVDHAAGDVIVVNGYRHMIGDGPDGPDRATLDRLRAVTAGRDTVVID